MGTEILFCAVDDFFFFVFTVFCLILFFHYPAVVLCSYGHTLSYTTFTRTKHLSSLHASPDPLWTLCPRWRPEASPPGTKTAAVHDTCSPKNSSICFISSSSPFISLLLSQFTLSFLLWPLPLHSEQVIPPEGQFYTLHLLYSPCCFLFQLSQPPLKPHGDRQPETSVPRAGSTNRRGRLKERSKLSERQWKEAKGQPRKILSRTNFSNLICQAKFDIIVKQGTKYKNYGVFITVELQAHTKFYSNNLQCWKRVILVHPCVLCVFRFRLPFGYG